jgi:hypothetical protein
MTTPGGREVTSGGTRSAFPGASTITSPARPTTASTPARTSTPSRPRLKRRGAGHTVYIRLEPEQVERLAAWVDHTDPKLLRDYRDAMLAAVASALR